MTHRNTFLKIAAIAAFLSAVTTFLLWLLPTLYQAPATFAESINLYKNGYYITKQWVNFFHIPLALTAYFGFAYIFFKRENLIPAIGMIWFAIWGAIEMIGVSIIIFSVNYNWRRNYELADDLKKNILENNIQAFTSIWDSMFFVLLIAFLLGSVFFAWASWKSRGVEKVLSYLLWISVPLTVLIIVGGYAGQDWAGQITQYVYPELQPVSRFVLGVFIWRSRR